MLLKPLPVDDPRRRCPSIVLAQRALDWRPRVALESGLAATADHFRRVLHLESERAATA